jgi:hypothetical protein
LCSFLTAPEQSGQSGQSGQYNPALAHLSMALSIAAYGEEYIIESLENHGFGNITTHNYGMGFNYLQPSFATAEKITPDGEKIVAAVIRGSVTFPNWLTNATVGGGDIHEGCAVSADYVREQLPQGDIYYITGFSFGGAIANLLAAELSQSGGLLNQRVFAYTFATPNVSRCTETDYSAYNIYNICNTLDMVTTLPTHVTGEAWHKYGTTVWFREEFYASSFFTHYRYLYLDVLSRLELPGEDGNLGDISEESPQCDLVMWARTEKITEKSFRKKKIPLM